MITNQPKVGIVVLNWNAYDHTKKCIQSLMTLRYQNYVLCVVDNGSSDESVSKLEMEFSQVVFVHNTENLGFAGGVNSGIAALLDNCEYIWLVNNDAQLGNAQALDKLVATCEDDAGIGAVGSVIVTPDGGIWFAGGEIRMPVVKGNHCTFALGEPRTSEYITGCSILMKTSALRLTGLLDDRYFLYYEDADLCFKINAQGFRCVVVPESLMIHEVGASSRKDPGLNYVYYNLRSRFLFADKWCSSRQKVMFYCIVTFETITRLAWYLLRRRWSYAMYLVRGFADGVKGRYGSLSQ